MTLRNLYRRFFARSKERIVRIHRTKTLIMERLEILRKRNIYKHIHWTPEQQKAFDNFWLEHYGKKISNRWHRLYEAINGHFCVEYTPEIIFTTTIELGLSPFLLASVLDKSFVEVLYDRPDGPVKIPETLGLCSHGFLYDGRRTITSREKLLGCIADAGEAIIKPTNASSGEDVRLMNLAGGRDTRTGKLLSDILDQYKDNFIIQKRLRQCSALAKIYDGAVNTIRITTYILDGEVFHSPLCLRIGSGGSHVDNVHAGGMGIGLSDEGVFRKYAYRLGHCDSCEKFTTHPDSGIVFEGYVLPNIDRVIRAAHWLHGRTPGLGMISWDMILDQDENPVVIEANLFSQGVWFPQIINEAPLFGKNTARMLERFRCR